MKVLGLTGGIASGKSTVAHLLAAAGGAIVDADVLAREAVAPGTPGLQAVVARFGAELVDARGQLDRRLLGARVFGDPGALADLNAIVHPAVRQAMQEALARLAASPAPPRFAVLVIPLLYEGGLQELVDEVWVVNVPPAVQRARLAARDGFDPAGVEARLASQWPLARKAELADRVIDNSGPPEALEPQVRAALRSAGLA